MTASSNALSNRQIARAAAVVLVGFLGSGLLGLVRTAIFSSTFGTTDALDAFYAAQRIPEALFVLVAGGALGSSFIPVFARYLTAKDQEGAWRLASAVMTLSALAATVLAVMVAVLAPILVPAILVPGDSPAVQALTVSLTQVMLVTVIIFSVSGLMMGILNAHQLFILPALALSMNNIGLIFGALVLTRVLPSTQIGDSVSASVYGPAIGAVIGALLHLLIQLPGLRPINARLRFLPAFGVPGVREVLTLMAPRVLGLAIVQINFIVNAALSSRMVEGSYTALTTAFTLMFSVLGIIAQSVGTAVFPSLSALAAAGDMVGFKSRLAGALRSVLFLSFPMTVGMIVHGGPLIALLFQRGAWTSEATAATAWALAFFAVGIAGFSALEILSRAFYALADTRTPVTIGILSMISNIVFSLLFIQFIGQPGSLSRGPFAGLALANALTTIAEALALWFLLQRRIGAVGGRVFDGALRALSASLVMGVAVWGSNQLLSGHGIALPVIAGVGVGAVVFFGVSIVLGVDEARTVPAVLLRRFRR